MAIWLGNKRFVAFGGEVGTISDLAIWVVPAGVIGARIYHVITDPELFFGKNGNLADIPKIWQGGLGIWGAIAGGAAIAYWRYQKIGSVISFWVLADALAPALLIAQGLGRFGNWFNGELFGRATTLPWALEIPSALRPQDSATYHPTFLYEAICNFLLAIFLIRMTDKFRAKNEAGSIFYLYVGGYCTYRFFIEGLRIDTAHNFAGLRLNQWVSLVLGGVAYTKFARSKR